MIAAALVGLLAVNLCAFAAMAADKRCAVVGLRRIPERVLLTWALFGGSIGVVAAQQMLRHKTRKQPFATWLLLIVAGQVVLAAAIWFMRA